jgi:hypothetical protein
MALSCGPYALIASCASVTAVASVQTVGLARTLTPGSFAFMQVLNAFVRSAPFDDVRSPSRSST